MQKQELKHDLIKRLKKANAFWSYDHKPIKDVPDDILVELVMLQVEQKLKAAIGSFELVSKVIFIALRLYIP